MSLLPHNDSAQSPFVWLVNFDEGAGFARPFEMAIADGAERKPVESTLACLKLGFGRAVDTLYASVPGGLFRFESGPVGSGADGVLVPRQPVATPRLGTQRTASRVFPGLTWDDVELSAADEALLLDFALASFSEGYGHAGPRAEPAPVSEAEWAHVEWLRAVRAVNDWHATIIAGAGTTRRVADAPLFTSFPPAEPPEDERMGDLFAAAAD